MSVKVSLVTESHEHVALEVYRSVEVSVVTWSHEHLALGVDMSV